MKYKNILKRMPLWFLVAIVLILFWFPFIFVLNTSLKPYMQFLTNPVGITNTLRFENYLEAWKVGKLGQYFLNSVFYVAVFTSVSILMSVFLSFPLSRKYVKSYKIVIMMFLIGMFLPDGSIPRWRIIFEMGLYNTRLAYFLISIGGGGVSLLMMMAYINNIPKDLDEAAIMDGCGYIQYIFKCLIPLMKPVIVSMGLLKAIGVWNEVSNSLIYLSNDKYYPLTRGLYVFKGQYAVKWPQLAAALVIVAFPMVVLYIFMQKQIIEGILAGGIKI